MSTPTTPEDELDDIFRRKLGEPHIEFNPEAWQAMERKLAGASSDNRAFWRKFSILGLLGILLVGSIVWYDFQPKSLTSSEEEARMSSVTLQQDTQAKNNPGMPSVGSFATPKLEQPTKVEQSGLNQGKVGQGRLDEHSASPLVGLPTNTLPENSPKATNKVEAEKGGLPEASPRTFNKGTIDKEKLTMTTTQAPSNKAKVDQEKRVIANSNKGQNGKAHLLSPQRGGADASEQVSRNEKYKANKDADQASALAPTVLSVANPPADNEALIRHKWTSTPGKSTVDRQVETNASTQNPNELARVADQDGTYDKGSAGLHQSKNNLKSRITSTPLAEKIEGNRGAIPPSESTVEQSNTQAKGNARAKVAQQKHLLTEPKAEKSKPIALPHTTDIPASDAAASGSDREQLQPIKLADLFLSTEAIAGPTAEQTRQLDALVDSLHAWQVASDSLAKPAVADTSTLRLAVPRTKARWSVTLALAPDFSVVGTGTLSIPGFTTGLGIAYQLSEKWSISTGVLYSNKIYSAKPDQYQVPPGYWGRWAPPKKIEGTCKVLDLPINLRYDFMKTQHLRYYAVLGVSSYVMLREKYSYEYVAYGKTQEKSWNIVNQNKHFFKVANLSVGYERSLNKRFSYQVEPYMKIPLAGIGAGKVKLVSAGAFLSVRYRFNKI